MFVRPLAALLFGALAIAASACGHDAAQAPSGPSAQAAVRAPVTLKVMTFNIQHGIDGRSRYNIDSAIAAIARVQPDIVGLQEVTRNHPFYNCDDQPERIASGVRAATGQNWDVIYQQEWFTPDVSCQASGRGDGKETEGLAFLTRRGLGGALTTALPDSRIGLQTAVRDAYGLPVVVTHLTSGSSASATRRQQVDRLVAWAAPFGAPLIVMGDLNAGPEGAELQPLFAGFHDAWSDALQMGRATGNANSHGSQRIDYIFFTPGAALTLQSAEVVNTAALIGVAASDHEPVVATFTVR